MESSEDVFKKKKEEELGGDLSWHTDDSEPGSASVSVHQVGAGPPSIKAVTDLQPKARSTIKVDETRLLRSFGALSSGPSGYSPRF